MYILAIWNFEYILSIVTLNQAGQLFQGITTSWKGLPMVVHLHDKNLLLLLKLFSLSWGQQSLESIYDKTFIDMYERSTLKWSMNSNGVEVVSNLLEVFNRPLCGSCHGQAVSADRMASKHRNSVLGTSLLYFSTAEVRISFSSKILQQILAQPLLLSVSL